MTSNETTAAGAVIAGQRIELLDRARIYACGITPYDVLDVAAGRAGAAYDEFAAIQQFGFDRDMAAIGVRSPDHEPRAHRYVTHVIRLAAELLEAGAAYQRGGSVYFRGAGVAEGAGLARD